MGSLLALYQLPRVAYNSHRQLIAVVGLLLVVVPAFVYNAKTVFPGLAAAPPCIGAALLIWIGTTGNGLFMASPTAGTITNFTIANGLANEIMYTLNERNGAIYASTGKGLTVITTNPNEMGNGKPEHSWKIKSYGKA